MSLLRRSCLQLGYGRPTLVEGLIFYCRPFFLLPKCDNVTFGYPSVWRLYAHTPYSAGWKFRQYFCAILYLCHPPTSMQNFTEIVQREPLHRGLNARGVAKHSDFWTSRRHIHIKKRCKTRPRFVVQLMTNRKSYIRRIHFGPSRMTTNKGFGSPILGHRLYLWS